MSEELRMLELLEEAFDSGLDPERCSADNPELDPELRRELAACQFLSDELDVLFPQSFIESKRVGDGSSLPDIAGYEVLSVLGLGGMGVVYKARHLALNRLVAIKMMVSPGRSSAVERERIKREAKSQAELKHAHIVQVFDVGELDGTPYFTMELMDGGSLREKLRDTPQSADYVASTMIKLAEAVEAAHKCGIIHRDLKPANVLLTADGVPKLSDFGLARKIQNDSLMTLPGEKMGTPSYMAPEQASRRFGAVGRASDVYALGAILYVMMTGRPPFRGESAADTERQLLNEEVVPPKRLNARVPRDLETICLKCLQKDPSRRYASAAELAIELVRWTNGEPITARRIGSAERFFKLARRRPTATTAVAAVVLLVLSICAEGLWLASQRRAAADAAADDVTAAALFQRQAKWDRAAGALERAESRLRGVGGGGPAWIREKLAAAERDQRLVDTLDKAWVVSQPILNDSFDRSRTAETFARAFADCGIGTVADDPKVVGKRIQDSNVKSAIIKALDEWWSCERSKADGSWIAAVACAADPDPTGWRDQVRQLRTPADKAVLAKLAQPENLTQQPIELIIRLGDHMKSAGMDPVPFYKLVVQARPSDVWANFSLGTALRGKGQNHLAVEYCRAAVALQPRLLAMQMILAQALWDDGRSGEALENLRIAAAADPDQPFYPLSAAALLLDAKRYSEAMVAADQAARLAPPALFWAPSYQAKALLGLGRYKEALQKVRLAMSIDPTSIDAQRDLRKSLQGLVRLDELLRLWKSAPTLNPPDLKQDWQGYAELNLYLGDTDAYRHIRNLLLDNFGKVTDARESEYVGRACLLLPASADELQRATASIDRALSNPSPEDKQFRGFFVLAKALADYRAGRYQEALRAVENKHPPSDALAPTQRLIAAMAHYELGQTDVALGSLRQAALASDWSPNLADNFDRWTNHILRREAERMIIPNFQAFLDGKYEPQSTDEQIALTAVCEETDRTATEARLWSLVLEREPKLADLYCARAVHAAALAGCGQGIDAGVLDEAARASWRETARKWAGNQLDLAEQLMAGNDAAKRSAGVKLTGSIILQLSPLMDPTKTLHLSTQEDDACKAILTRASHIMTATKDQSTQ